MGLTFSNFFVLIKRHWDGCIGDHSLMEVLYSIITEDGNSDIRDIYPDKSRTSNIKHCRANVHKKLKKYLMKSTVILWKENGKKALPQPAEKTLDILTARFQKNIIKTIKNASELISDFMELINKDTEISPKDRDELQSLAKEETLAEFLASAFRHAVLRNNVASPEAEESASFSKSKREGGCPAEKTPRSYNPLSFETDVEEEEPGYRRDDGTYVLKDDEHSLRYGVDFLLNRKRYEDAYGCLIHEQNQINRFKILSTEESIQIYLDGLSKLSKCPLKSGSVEDILTSDYFEKFFVEHAVTLFRSGYMFPLAELGLQHIVEKRVKDRSMTPRLAGAYSLFCYSVHTYAESQPFIEQALEHESLLDLELAEELHGLNALIALKNTRLDAAEDNYQRLSENKPQSNILRAEAKMGLFRVGALKGHFDEELIADAVTLLSAQQPIEVAISPAYGNILLERLAEWHRIGAFFGILLQPETAAKHLSAAEQTYESLGNTGRYYARLLYTRCALQIANANMSNDQLQNVESSLNSIKESRELRIETYETAEIEFWLGVSCLRRDDKEGAEKHLTTALQGAMSISAWTKAAEVATVLDVHFKKPNAYVARVIQYRRCREEQEEVKYMKKWANIVKDWLQSLLEGNV